MLVIILDDITLEAREQLESSLPKQDKSLDLSIMNERREALLFSSTSIELGVSLERIEKHF